jgi:NAD(P)-dependent dehydrogenase (short-subunit alcohol dehydrogenase family)
MTRQRVLITGGHKRLGRAVARHLAGLGARVAIHYRRDAELAEALALELGGIAVGGELTDSADVARLVAAVTRAWGGLDLLVASAATWQPTDLASASVDALDAALHSNARAPVELILRCRPHLEASADGRVVVFGDLAGVTPFRGYLGHSMAKAALHAAVRGLAVELAPRVTVNAVLPGAVLRPEDDTAASWAALQRAVPMGELALEDPDEPVRAVVEAVAWLASCSRYLTGVLLPVDGGRSARW